MEQQSDGLKVMVIDDSKTIRRTAETLLKKVGCDVITAIDGFDALAKIADTHPNIIFVDIMMPRLDGYQTCALIKNNSAFKSTPVIMLSSKDGLFDLSLIHIYPRRTQRTVRLRPSGQRDPGLPARPERPGVAYPPRRGRPDPVPGSR